jgi:hypothetical protein
MVKSTTNAGIKKCAIIKKLVRTRFKRINKKESTLKLIRLNLFACSKLRAICMGK